MTQEITGAAFKSMVINAAAAIDKHKNEINELNVFPVPDGDTGTNMSLTMGAGATALSNSAPGTIGRASDVTAGSLLRGARGNSGVILSLLFRGIARHLKDRASADAEVFAAAMEVGVESAYKAVMKPAEGTILTVSRVAAAAAIETALTDIDIEVVLEHALAEGREALKETVNQNPVLKKAGVVDAGAKGYLYILEAMLGALRGEVIEKDAVPAAATAEKANFSDFETQDIKFTYCTEFIASKKTQKDVNLLRDFLDMRGDSIVVVEDDDVIKVHVHSNEPGVIITEALTYGPLISIKVENMREQHTEKILNSVEVSREEEKKAEENIPEKKFGAVAVCAGDGMSDVFRDLGVDGIITGGQTMNPSTEDILEKIESTPAEVVFVLPNNKNIIMAAQQCIPLAHKKVVVIPTKTMPQGISAMIAFDSAVDTEENTEHMTEAASHVHTAQITYAARNSEYDGHSISSGDYLALLESSLIANGSDINDVIDAVAAKLKEFSPEFITLFRGEGVTEEDAGEVAKRIAGVLPSAETAVVFGGQPVYYYMISAE